MFFCCIIASLALSLSDTLSLNPATVVSTKEPVSLEKLSSPSTRFATSELAGHGIEDEHSLTQFVPGLHIPEYGASLTSTIYIRGLGSRMENPSLGLYLDNIPVLDKNAYDFSWFGIHSGALLRGPQGSLYGRNSIGGVLLLKTPSASEICSTEATAETGWPALLRLGVSGKAGAHHSFSGIVTLKRGYFENVYSGKPADPYAGCLFRWRWDKAVSAKTKLSNSLHLGFSSEGGFAYSRYLDEKIQPVNYNDEGSYRRLSLIDGLKLEYLGRHIRLSSVTSIQLLMDRMRMDQDFTPESIFTLEQSQRSAAVTQEFIIKPIKKHDHWKPQTGLFAFAKLNRMNAPVTFKEAGIQSLILDNANRNIPADIGRLEIMDSSFPVLSTFLLGNWNAALFHESVWNLGRWLITAGIRLDYEGSSMDYDSEALINYRFVPYMQTYKAFSKQYRGYREQHHLQLMPKGSVLYDFFPEKNGFLRAYGTVAKGFRAGGFNTQIFSDILQGIMMTGMMSDLGVYLDNTTASVTAEHTEYKPETAWNYELGMRFYDGTALSGELNAYYIDCLNQQLTVFPAGKSTGRMMTNAGKSRSIGLEAELDYRRDKLHMHLAYSYCDARFREYFDGNADYSGNRIPYVPVHSCYFSADRSFTMLGLSWLARGDLRSSGPFWWNEANSVSSGHRMSLGALLRVDLDRMNIYLRCENILGRQYPEFYFKSVGNEFFSLSRPRQITMGLTFKLSSI